MSHSLYSEYHNFLRTRVLKPFYLTRLQGLESLRLETLLKRKNPYLFRAKNLEIPSDLVRSIIDAFLSSQEETVFGNLLESFAIFVSEKTDRGFKTKGFASVDLQFIRDDICYIVSIKSGTSWGNHDQINAMKNNFKKAKILLREQGVTSEIIAVNGCMYGRDSNPLKNTTNRGSKLEEPDKVYYKYAGQVFWHFISQDEDLYQEMIVPIGEEAQQQDETFKKVYHQKVNEFTHQFMQGFMTDHQIDWAKLLAFVSKRD